MSTTSGHPVQRSRLDERFDFVEQSLPAMNETNEQGYSCFFLLAGDLCRAADFVLTTMVMIDVERDNHVLLQTLFVLKEKLASFEILSVSVDRR